MPLGTELALDTAKEAAGLGYRSFWTAETTGPEAFSLLAAAGAAAPGLDLGTGVLALQLRTPMVAAMGAATLQSLHPEADILLGVGILGGFTTFSSFSLDAALMIERRDYALASAYILASVTLSILALFAGMMAARRLFA